MDLVILAGGLGSRFGGLKQIEPIDDNGNFIIDYSVFDSIKCGFNKIIFVINSENFYAFKNTIGKRIENKIQVDYVFQDFSNVPQKYNIPSTRTKPLGTAHAILCAENKVSENFAVINADDFYGFNALKSIHEFLEINTPDDVYAMVGYQLKNTILGNQKVKRGLCILNHGLLESIDECEVVKTKNCYYKRSLDNNLTGSICRTSENRIVSMNLFGFKRSIFKYLSQEFFKFLELNSADLSACEFYISTFLTTLIHNDVIKLQVIPTSEKWIGMTYKEDKCLVKNKILELVQQQKYPENLWQNPLY